MPAVVRGCPDAEKAVETLIGIPSAVSKVGD
jgi:hypothetical protein